VPPKAGRTAPVWIVGVIVLILVGLVGYFLSAIGPCASIIGMLLAFVPLAAVLFAIRIIDRWEPEPRGLLVLAVAWGAVAAVGITLGVDLLVSMVLGVDDSLMRDAFSAVVQAPIVEEFAKGLGVYLIFVTARRAFRRSGGRRRLRRTDRRGVRLHREHPVLRDQLHRRRGGRCVDHLLRPRHPLAFRARDVHKHHRVRPRPGGPRGASAGRAVGPWMLGMMGAMSLHALWNGSVLFGDFFLLYLTLQVPLFVGFILGIIALRREEARLTRSRLGDYAAAGWFTPQEVTCLRPGGAQGGSGVGGGPAGDRTGTMKTFIADATALAAARQRAISGRDKNAREDEQVLLVRTTAARAAMFAP
jgi:RsiW-degrading membrane proteinase PrsW (M82 family)